ncbi:MAG: tetratricopeptide repeat protein [Sideroxyarcus sp.]
MPNQIFFPANMFNWLKKTFPIAGITEPLPVADAFAGKQPEKIDPLSESAAYKKQGNEFLAQGRLNEAIECYRQAVSISPGYAEAYLNLGFALHGQQLIEEAEMHLKHAIQINPEMEDAYYLLGNMAQEQGDLENAIENFNKALELKPDFEIVYRDLCQCLIQSGKIEASKRTLEKAISVNPDSADFYFLQGNLFASEKKPDKATSCYRKVLSIQPDNAEVHCLLGDIFSESGHFDEAIASYRSALALQPDYADAHNKLGAAFRKNNNLEDAMACFIKALALQPDSATFNSNLGVVYKEMGKLDEAVACYRKALSSKPEFPEALTNLGNIFREQENPDDAIACYNEALTLKPDLVMANSNLGGVLLDQHKLDQAAACFRKVLELSPESHQARLSLIYIRLHECDWNDLETNSEIVRQAVREQPPNIDDIIVPFPLLALPGATPEEQRICAEKWAQIECKSQILRHKKMEFVFKRKSKPKIHVGYFSSDLRRHPVSQLMAEVFELHDRNRFHISAYSYGADDGSDVRKRLEKAFDQFVDMREFSDEDIAQRIYLDQTDILVDLTGYTHNSRSRILTFRPAPVQVGYIGYLGTMGGNFMDYIIADPFLIPPEDQKYYTEKVAYLPFYQANDRQCAVAETPSRKACGLPQQGIVFCSFNQTYKILPDVFDVWMRLLTASPGSVLWLYASNQNAIDNLQREAHARGVSPERLIFAETLPLDQHLARMKCADLFLDTLPYNAGTTASNALWAGLPIVTCAGKTFPSRMAGSLLTAMGVPELITYNLDDYYSLALDLARDRNKRETIRNKIIANRDLAPLFDSKLFTRNLEAAYTKMLEDYLNAPER